MEYGQISAQVAGSAEQVNVPAVVRTVEVVALEVAEQIAKLKRARAEYTTAHYAIVIVCDNYPKTLEEISEEIAIEERQLSALQQELLSLQEAEHRASYVAQAAPYAASNSGTSVYPYGN